MANKIGFFDAYDKRYLVKEYQRDTGELLREYTIMAISIIDAVTKENCDISQWQELDITLYGTFYAHTAVGNPLGYYPCKNGTTRKHFFVG